MKINPKFGSAIIADSARHQGNGKIDAHGIFTCFLTWGYPATRGWALVVTVFNLPEKQTTFIASIKRRDNKEESSLLTADFAPGKGANESTFLVNIGYRFEKEGFYEIVCSLKDFNTRLSIPVRVITQAWPEINEKELTILRQNRNKFLNRLSLQISCKSCDHVYVFEEIIIPEDEVTPGAIRIPENGHYECQDCGHVMKLKDFQGQIRASIKENLNINSSKHSSHV
jgi:hypothetical protein